VEGERRRGEKRSGNKMQFSLVEGVRRRGEKVWE